MGVRRAALRIVPAIAAVVLAVASTAADAGAAKRPPRPKITPPANVTAEATSPRGAIVVFRSAKVVNAFKVTYSRRSGTWFRLGTTVVTVTAKDRAGHVARAKFKVTVVDTTAPVLTQPADVTGEATGITGATVTYTAPTATDVVNGSLTALCSPASGSNFALGTTTVTCTATDRAGNRASVTFSAKVVDTTPPKITAHADVTQAATSAAGATVYFSLTATDLTTAVVSVTCTPPSGSVFAIGTTTVTCTARDSSGNSAATSFRVTVTPLVAVPGSYAGTTSQGKTITFTVSSDAGLTSISIGNSFTCASGGSGSGTFTMPSTSIAADGTFSTTATLPVSGAGTIGTSTGTFAGRFVVPSASASGTFELTMTLTAPEATSCSTGHVTWTASRVG